MTTHKNHRGAPPPGSRERTRPGRPPVLTARERALENVLSPRYKAFMAGEIKVEDLTLEELRNGAINDEGYDYARRPPELIPRAFQQAVTREYQISLRQKFELMAARAIDVIGEVMEKGEGEQYDQYSRAGTGRLKAAQEIVNRVLGKVPDKVEATVALTPWEQLAAGAELITDVIVEDLPDER